MKTVYTDGSCLGNPGAGGWAFLVIHNDEGQTRKWGSYINTTNNQMELQAVIEAIKYINTCEKEKTDLYTDSNYVKKGITEWIQSWKNNNWKNSSNKEIKNLQLWKELDILAQNNTNIEFKWIKAHNGNIYNEIVDGLARAAARSAQSV